MFLLLLNHGLTYSIFFVVVVETISTICLSLLCFSFVRKYLVWMKPHTPLEAHNKEQTNVWISAWNGVGERERDQKRKILRRKGGSTLETFCYYNDFLVMIVTHRHRHRHKYIVVETWILFCVLCALVCTQSVSTWLLAHFVWYLPLSPSPILSFFRCLFHSFRCAYFLSLSCTMDSGTWKNSLLIHTSKIKVEPYFGLMISLSKHWNGPKVYCSVTEFWDN